MFASACSGGHAGPTPTTLRSLTPRVTTAPAAALERGLLTAADLAALPHAPAPLQLRSINAGSAYQDPDPRGPCGAKLAPPALSGAAGELLQSSNGFGFDLVIPAGVSAAQAFVTATAADTRPGCAPFQSRTNTGQLQTQHLLTPVSLGAGPDQQTGALLQLTPPGAPPVYEFEAAIRVGSLLSIDVIVTPAAPPADFLRALAQQSAQRLRSVPQ